MSGISMSSPRSTGRHSRRGGARRGAGGFGTQPVEAEGAAASCEPPKVLEQEQPSSAEADKAQALLPILRRLPTPGRSLASAVPPPRAPEPWNSPSGASGASAPQAGGYRERLQAQGQHAMQRSVKPDAVAAAARSTALPVAPPVALAGALSPQAAAWGASQLQQLQQMQQMQQLQQLQQLQSWLGATAGMSLHQPLQPPSPCGPLPLGCSMPQAGLMGTCGLVSPCPLAQGGALQWPQVPGTPAAVSAPPPSPSLAGGQSPGQSPQELLASVMPNAFCMDTTEIESQLLAAANQIESYDD